MYIRPKTRSSGVKVFLKTLRTGVVYSDDTAFLFSRFKPDNIFVLQGGRLKVTNFGITKIESTDLTQMGDVLGIPYYMSPEMITGRPVDCRSDLFSVGVIFYHLLSGEMPFPGNSVNSVMHHVLKSVPPPVSVENSLIPAGIDPVINKAMAKMVQQRFQNSREFSTALQKFR